MKINFENKNQVFTSRGAGQLKGLFMAYDTYGIATEINKLTPKTGLKVYSLDKNNNVITDNFLEKRNPVLTWVQDLFSFTQNKLLIDTEFNSSINEVKQIGAKLCEYFNLKYEPHSYHMQGGNFILNETANSRDIFVGQYDLQRLSKNEIAKRFDADNVFEIPQEAAHLDAFMFVDGKRAFVCDDDLMLYKIKEALTYIEDNFIKFGQLNTCSLEIFEIYLKLVKLFNTFNFIAKKSRYATTQAVEKALDKTGYETVRIPARLYGFIESRGQFQHQYGTNFANAILHKNNAGDTIMITNASYTNDNFFGFDKDVEEKINFSFRKIFLDAISPYIKRENVHFIQGKDNGVAQLFARLGGIHCGSTEIV